MGQRPTQGNFINDIRDGIKSFKHIIIFTPISYAECFSLYVSNLYS